MANLSDSLRIYSIGAIRMGQNVIPIGEPIYMKKREGCIVRLFCRGAFGRESKTVSIDFMLATAEAVKQFMVEMREKYKCPIHQRDPIETSCYRVFFDRVEKREGNEYRTLQLPFDLNKTRAETYRAIKSAVPKAALKNIQVMLNALAERAQEINDPIDYEFVMNKFKGYKMERIWQL